MIGQFNIARARWPLDDPRMSGFTDAAWRINALAERSDGFVWRMKDETGPDGPKFPGDPLMTVTISVWRDLDALRAFTWTTLHKRFRMRRAEWFEPHTGRYLVMWDIPDGHRPNGAEAQAALARLEAEGPGPGLYGVEALTPATTS